MISDRTVNSSGLAFSVETGQVVQQRMESICYEIYVDAQSLYHRLELSYENVQEFGVVLNAGALGGVLGRKEAQK